MMRDWKKGYNEEVEVNIKSYMNSTKIWVNLYHVSHYS